MNSLRCLLFIRLHFFVTKIAKKKPVYFYTGLTKTITPFYRGPKTGRRPLGLNKSWHRATLPQRCRCTTIAAGGLNF